MTSDAGATSTSTGSAATRRRSASSFAALMRSLSVMASAQRADHTVDIPVHPAHLVQTDGATGGQLRPPLVIVERPGERIEAARHLVARFLHSRLHVRRHRRAERRND